MNLSSARSSWRTTVAASTLVGIATFAILAGLQVAVAPKAAAADSSAVTLTAAQQDPDAANAPFPNLAVTVSQTTNLVGQGIRLDYSGGLQSTVPNQQTAGANFLQVMQCWGDLKDANGKLELDAHGNAQPDRTTCQYGSALGLGYPGQSRTSTKSSLQYVSTEDDQYLYPGSGSFDPPQVSIPFRSVTGKTLQQISGGKIVSSDSIDDNEFFTRNTTNELPWAGFGASGAGTASFEVQTNAQAPGLGCGQQVAAADGAVTGQSCWLVVLPRGTHDLGEQYVTKSGLLWETWKHRLAVKLTFKPLGVRCAIGAAEKSLAGSELMTAAVGSWQPKLCSAASGSIYNLIVTDEADQLAASNGTETSALALTTRALDTSTNGATDNLTYAPVAVSGLTIGFAIDHNSSPIQSGIPASVTAQDAQPITGMNLTPRLVAKLLTDSYRSSLPTGANTSYVKSNPYYLWQDPDFLAVNDAAWKYQDLSGPGHLADLIVPLGRSDAAVAMWKYVLSDADAVAFLAGKADPWGMTVNPYSATDASINPTGTAATYPQDSFPKADPVSFTPPGMGEINLVTWRPYANDLDTSGYWVLRGDSRVIDDASWNKYDATPKYGYTQRDLPGRQRVIGLTGTATAAKYEIRTAALLNPAGRYVQASGTSMAAAAAVMTAVSGQPQVEALDYASAAVKAASGAYPLTVPIYAATNASGGDASTRAAYAAFIRYAANKGQTPGTDDGELPDGYAPLPASWVAAADKAATTIAAGPTAAPTAGADASGTGTPDTAQTSVDVSRASDAPVSSEVLAAGAAPVVASSPSPTASGAAAGPLVGAATPGDPSVGPLRAVIPASALGGLLAAGCVPLISRIRREP